jgi:hypothetical protein
VVSLLQKLTFDREKWFFYWTPLFAYCVLIFALSAQQKAVSIPGLPSGDRLLHVIEYAILGFLMTRAFFSLDTRRSQAFLFMVSLIFSLVFGCTDEFHQYFVPGRTASLADVMADGIGALIGASFYWARIRTRHGTRTV